MDTPLAIETAIITNIDAIMAIGWIIRKARDAKNFRDKCIELSRDAALLQSILQIRSNGVKNLGKESGLADCLQRVRDFIRACSDYNILQTAWEVFSGNHNFLGLKSDLLKYVTFFMADSLVRSSNLRTYWNCQADKLTRQSYWRTKAVREASLWTSHLDRVPCVNEWRTLQQPPRLWKIASIRRNQFPR